MDRCRSSTAAARRAVRDVRDAARAATPQFGQNGISGYNGVAVRAEHPRTRIDRVVLFVHQSGLHTDPQCDQGERGDHKVQSEMHGLRDRYDVHHAHHSVKAKCSQAHWTAMRVLRPNHSATPARPPSAAEVIGKAMTWIPA